jgi:hypothetical protein
VRNISRNARKFTVSAEAVALRSTSCLVGRWAPVAELLRVAVDGQRQRRHGAARQDQRPAERGDRAAVATGRKTMPNVQTALNSTSRVLMVEMCRKMR